MPQHSLSFRFTAFFFFMLVVGMLLLDVVASGFWLRHAVHLQKRHMDNLLFSVATVPARALTELQIPGFCLYSMKDKNMQGSKVCLQDAEGQSLALLALWGKAELNRPGWAGRMVRTVQLKNTSVQLAQDKALLVLVEGKDTAFTQLIFAQRYILTYLLINAVLLSIIFYVRFVQQITRPLQKAADVADRYQMQEASFAFPVAERLGELQRLSFSLNGMMRRLDQDRVTLKKSAEELALKNKQLVQNQEEMIRAEKLAVTGRLSAGLAHEVGNPLGIVQGYLELLSIENCTEKERLEYSNKALRETERIHGLLRRLLDSTRNTPAARERLDIQELLDDFTETLAGQPLLKGITLELLAESPQLYIEADEDKIRQVLLNGVINAVDAIHAKGGGGGRIELQICQLEEGDHLFCDVVLTDNGCGLPEKYTGKIFDPFFTTKEPGAGTGLGLSVSLALMESMKGSLRVENREGGGVSLHLLFPLVDKLVEAAHLEQKNGQ